MNDRSAIQPNQINLELTGKLLPLFKNISIVTNV